MTNNLQKTVTLLLTCITLNANSQIIDQIKSASDDHNSSSSSDDYSYDSDDDYNSYDYSYDDTYDDSYDDYSTNSYSPNFNRPDNYWANKRADSNYKFSGLSLGYRSTTNSNKVRISVPELQFKIGHYYGAFRVLNLYEERPSTDDSYQTVDVQILGFQTNPKGIAVFNLSVGIMNESYSGMVYGEFVSGFRLNLGNRASVRWEGRLAVNDGISVRTEGNYGANYAIFKNKDFHLDAEFFATSTTYYEEVHFSGFGFGISANF